MYVDCIIKVFLSMCFLFSSGQPVTPQMQQRSHIYIYIYVYVRIHVRSGMITIINFCLHSNLVGNIIE